MKLIVNTEAHGIKTGEYTGAKLEALMKSNRAAVTSLVARGKAKWDHSADAPVAAPKTTADKPAD